MSELFHSVQGSDWLFELIICLFLLLGGVFCLGGSIGLLRFPDIYCKMQALSKPVTLGIFNLIIAYILFLLYAGVGLSMKGVLAVVFLLLTIPIGSHMIIKASYRSGVPIWTESLMDQLADTKRDEEENREAQIRAEVREEVWTVGSGSRPAVTATLTEKMAAAIQREAEAEHVLTDKAEDILDLYMREWTRDPMNPLNVFGRKGRGSGHPKGIPPKSASRRYKKSRV